MFKRRYVFLFLLLFIFWLALTSSLAIESIIIGLIVSALITWYSKNIAFTEEETTIYKLSGIIELIKFMWNLVIEIIHANIAVVKIVLNPALPISPRFVVVPIPENLKRDFSKVLYANAITLTPGTLTVDILEEGYLIHAIDEDSGDGVAGSSLEEYTMRVEEA